ncbi:MAG: ATP-binding protein [Pseudomonadota bacterium]
MQSIRARLKVLFVVIVTLVLLVFGLVSQATLARELDARGAEFRNGVVTRLQISLPTPMWDLANEAVGEILAAELLPPEVQAIRIYDSGNVYFTGKARNNGAGVSDISKSTPVPPGGVSVPLTFRGPGAAEGGVKVGYALINFSDARSQAALAAQWKRKAVEILLLDLILIGALSLSLRMVFTPLKLLRERLDALARRDTDEVDQLPELRRDEFGEVAAAFNRILSKLKAIITRARTAEAAAVQSEKLTSAAYHELSMAQDSLVQAERLASLGAQVASMAHEINTPVGIAHTSASVLLEATRSFRAAIEEGGVKKADMLGYLDIAGESSELIMGNTGRAAHLIQSFKQVSADQTCEMRRRFALREYVGEIITSLRPRINQSCVQVLVDCPDGIELDGFPGAFAQIITNLVINALVHAFEGGAEGSIHIGVAQVGQEVEIAFRDTGRGIEPNLLDKVFDPFFTTRRGQGGTGLGLNIVYNLIVKTLGGSIKVASTVGQGSCFTIRIPQVAP